MTASSSANISEGLTDRCRSAPRERNTTVKQTHRRDIKADPFEVKLIGIMLVFVVIMVALVVLSCWR